MVTAREATRMALALAGAEEKDHHGFPSFRVGGRIFSTLPESTLLNVMVDPLEAESAVSAAPQACRALYWGESLRGVQVILPKADKKLVAALLSDAWAQRARPGPTRSRTQPRAARRPRRP